MESKIAEKFISEMYLEFREHLYWYVRKKVNSDELAEDITSDAFIKLLDNEELVKKRDKNGVKAWLYTVARNMIIDYYRKKSSNVEKVDFDSEVFELLTAQEDNNIQTIIKDEEYQLILAKMEALSSAEKEVINLRFQEDLKFSEIAEMLDKDEGAVKMILYRALEKIKKDINLKDDEKNGEK